MCTFLSGYNKDPFESHCNCIYIFFRTEWSQSNSQSHTVVMLMCSFVQRKLSVAYIWPRFSKANFHKLHSDPSQNRGDTYHNVEAIAASHVAQVKIQGQNSASVVRKPRRRLLDQWHPPGRGQKIWFIVLLGEVNGAQQQAADSKARRVCFCRPVQHVLAPHCCQ